MAESRLNIELFKKIRQRIAEIPESYDQNNWYKRSKASPCGTVACLAGETIICAASTTEEGIAELKRLYARDPRNAVPERAAQLLNLRGSWRAYLEDREPEAAGETAMFDGDALHWPERFADMYAEGNEAEAAVAYLDHIIETGKVME